MITDEQVERVARAIYEATGYDFDGRTINAAGQPYGAWALAIKQARAALEAARAAELAGDVEAVAWRVWYFNNPEPALEDFEPVLAPHVSKVEPLYLHPPQSRREGMEEAARIAESIRGAETSDFGEGMDAASDRIAQAIREAAKEKKDVS
jgi:hypothetical protein